MFKNKNFLQHQYCKKLVAKDFFATETLQQICCIRIQNGIFATNLNNGLVLPALLLVNRYKGTG